MTVEMAIIPTARAIARVRRYQCPVRDELPEFELNVAMDEEEKVFGGVGTQFAFRVASGQLVKHEMPFTLPMKEGSFGWRMEAVMGADFLTSDALGMLLHPLDEAFDERECFMSTTCELGVNERENENVITVNLIPPWRITPLQYPHQVTSSDKINIIA